MAKVEANISMSLDGFVTGPNLDRYPGLGEGGEILHAWTDESRSMDFAMGEERQIAGSVITSRKVYDETGGWDAEDGFYRMPVFVVTHRPHD
ncbi:MAG: riboflavin biosynthesis protein RibD, partial [Propionibacteriaceae bacterium]|nr:riboflavin biosynthesis protein RibD [Propionibacteriaceae bacterium]